MNKIIVIGSLNMDLVIETERVPNKGETILGTNFFTSPGGKGANQAVCCGKQNALVYMVGCVGNDNYGDMLINNLNNYEVNTKYINRIEYQPTGVAMIIIAENDNRIIVNPGANYEITKSDVKKAIDEIGEKNDILIVQMEIPYDVVEFSLKYAKEKNIKTIFNPSPAKKIQKELLPYVDLIVANEHEVKVLTGIEVDDNNLKQVFNTLSQLGVKKSIITMGKSGSCISINNQVYYIKSYEVEAIDTTAAGDTYLGALASELIKGNNIVDSMKYASIASALAVTKKGAQSSIPTILEVQRIIKK